MPALIQPEPLEARVLGALEEVTLTAPACPLGEQIAQDAELAVGALPGVERRLGATLNALALAAFSHTVVASRVRRAGLARAPSTPDLVKRCP